MANLPLSLDVQISIIKTATLGRLRLDTLCIVGTTEDYSNFAIYSSLAEVLNDFASDTDEYKAANIFFAQTPRPSQLAIAQIQNAAAVNVATDFGWIQTEAASIDNFVYGWCLTATLAAVVGYQEAVATWALGQDRALFSLQTADPNALDPDAQTDIGYILKSTQNRRAFPMYCTQADQYPEVSLLTYMLSVNYQLQNSTVTAKFKQLPGCTPETLTSTDWATLKAKGYNVYSFTGTNARVYREGTSSDFVTPWYMDTIINMDNFAEDLGVNVYNVFLRNPKVPYTTNGVLLLTDACKDTGNQYVYNGTFADRLVTDTSQKSGTRTVPAVDITYTPINQMSASDRAERIGPPITMVVQEASAIHSIAITVQVVS